MPHHAAIFDPYKVGKEKGVEQGRRAIEQFHRAAQRCKNV